MTVEQFFTRYAALSMGEDERALAEVYAPSFFVAGPKGSMTFANDAAFLDYLVRVRGFNREHGMSSVSPVAVREKALSPLHVLAQVRWSARFEKTGASCDRVRDCLSDGDGRRILARARVHLGKRSGGGNAGARFVVNSAEGQLSNSQHDRASRRDTDIMLVGTERVA